MGSLAVSTARVALRPALVDEVVAQAVAAPFGYDESRREWLAAIPATRRGVATAHALLAPSAGGSCLTLPMGVGDPRLVEAFEAWADAEWPLTCPRPLGSRAQKAPVWRRFVLPEPGQGRFAARRPQGDAVAGVIAWFGHGDAPTSVLARLWRLREQTATMTAAEVRGLREASEPISAGASRAEAWAHHALATMAGPLVVHDDGMTVHALPATLPWLSDVRRERIRASVARARACAARRKSTPPTLCDGMWLQPSKMVGEGGDVWLVTMAPAVATPCHLALPLTPTQTAIATMIARGCSVGDVAAALERSVETVRAHLKEIYRRLGIHRRAELLLRLQGQLVVDAERVLAGERRLS